MKALRKSIREKGFLVPLVVRPFGDKFEILSGNHRFMAGQEEGLTEYPVVIINCSGEEAKVIAMNLNTIHGDPPAVLMAPFLAELSDESLGEIHLDKEALEEIIRFDEDLGNKLKAMEIPDDLNRDSPKGPKPNCVCEKCGNRHVAKV